MGNLFPKKIGKIISRPFGEKIAWPAGGPQHSESNAAYDVGAKEPLVQRAIISAITISAPDTTS